MQQCDMHVRIRNAQAQHLLDPYRQCKRRGIYIMTDRHGEHWVFCKQHFKMYTAEDLG